MQALDQDLRSPEAGEFRRRVRAFLAEHLPDAIRAQVEFERMDLSRQDQQAWHTITRTHGLACPSWPKSHGGAGLG